MTTNPNTPLTGQTPTSGDPPGQTPTTPPPGQTPPPSHSQTTLANGSQQQTPITNLPPDIQDYIQRLRAEAEEANKLRKAEAKAKQEAEAARLKEQNDFKTLAEKHEARVKELEPVQESYTRLATTINAQIADEIKDWPPEVKSLVPASDTPVESRLEQMTRLRPLLEKLQVQARGTQPGNSPNPRPQTQTPEGASNEYMQRLRATGKYGA